MNTFEQQIAKREMYDPILHNLCFWDSIYFEFRVFDACYKNSRIGLE